MKINFRLISDGSILFLNWYKMKDLNLIVYKDIYKFQLDRYYLTNYLIANKFLKLLTSTYL